MTEWVKMNCIFALAIFNGVVINETELLIRKSSKKINSSHWHIECSRIWAFLSDPSKISKSNIKYSDWKCTNVVTTTTYWASTKIRSNTCVFTKKKPFGIVCFFSIAESKYFPYFRVTLTIPSSKRIVCWFKKTIDKIKLNKWTSNIDALSTFGAGIKDHIFCVSINCFTGRNLNNSWWNWIWNCLSDVINNSIHIISVWWNWTNYIRKRHRKS